MIARSARWLLIAFALSGTAALAQPPQGEGGAAPPQSAGPPPRPRDCVDIESLVARVAASTGQKFVLDPRVRACVTLVPELPNPTYAELLTVLRIHGYTAAEIGGFVNVIPDQLARATPVRLVQRDDRSIPDDEWVTRVLTVNGSAPQLVPVLRPMMPQSAHLSASADLNKLIIVDTYANVRRITEVIRTLTE